MLRQTTSSVPIFANGAISAAFVYMFNHATEALNRKLLRGAHDGHLTLEEANYWYKHGRGGHVRVDASKLTVLKVYKDGGAIVLGSDYVVHGQVTLASNGGIYHDTYDLTQNGDCFTCDGWLGLRNGATYIADALVGAGTPFPIHFYNKPIVQNRPPSYDPGYIAP